MDERAVRERFCPGEPAVGRARARERKPGGVPGAVVLVVGLNIGVPDDVLDDGLLYALHMVCGFVRGDR